MNQQEGKSGATPAVSDQQFSRSQNSMADLKLVPSTNERNNAHN